MFSGITMDPTEAITAFLCKHVLDDFGPVTGKLRLYGGAILSFDGAMSPVEDAFCRVRPEDRIRTFLALVDAFHNDDARDNLVEYVPADAEDKLCAFRDTVFALHFTEPISGTTYSTLEHHDAPDASKLFFCAAPDLSITFHLLRPRARWFKACDHANKVPAIADAITALIGKRKNEHKRLLAELGAVWAGHEPAEHKTTLVPTDTQYSEDWHHYLQLFLVHSGAEHVPLMRKRWMEVMSAMLRDRLGVERVECSYEPVDGGDTNFPPLYVRLVAPTAPKNERRAV